MDKYIGIIDLLRAGSRILICSHYNPDGDGIGSMLAMGMLLERIGKKVVLYCRDKVPVNLEFLPTSQRITNKLPQTDKFDLTLMLDCAQRKRISDDFAQFKGTGKVICIDHHLLEKPESDIDLIDSEAASTGEVVLRLARRAGYLVEKKIAQCIYTTLVVDTGFFKYSNTNEEIFSLASQLVRLGADPWTVAKYLEESHPLCRMVLLGFSLASLHVEFKGKYATMDVTQKMLKESKAVMELSDEFATYPRAIEGVEVSALFREYGDGRIKVSLRSKDTVDVAAIARSFGGGGHARAAGFQTKLSLKEAKEKLLSELKNII